MIKPEEVEASVSRETLEDLKEYHAQLLKWNRAINLIAKSTLSEAWQRHVLDGVQLWPLLGSFERLVDLGSGGGIPGIPLAVAAKHHGTTGEIILVESDRRKSAFLSTMCQKLSLPARVITARIEEAPPQAADVCTARALAATSNLFLHAERHLRPRGKCLFLKGEKADKEIAAARKSWDFSLQLHPSKTAMNAKILEVGDLQRV